MALLFFSVEIFETLCLPLSGTLVYRPSANKFLLSLNSIEIVHFFQSQWQRRKGKDNGGWIGEGREKTPGMGEGRGRQDSIFCWLVYFPNGNNAQGRLSWIQEPKTLVPCGQQEFKYLIHHLLFPSHNGRKSTGNWNLNQLSVMVRECCKWWFDVVHQCQSNKSLQSPKETRLYNKSEITS